MSMRTKALGQISREFKAHLRQLDADVGVQLAGFHLVQEAMVNLGGLVGLGHRGHAFTQGVEGNRDALAVDGFGHAQGIVDLHAGNKPRAEPRAQPGLLTESA
jgi:hypothetical protein